MFKAIYKRYGDLCTLDFDTEQEAYDYLNIGEMSESMSAIGYYDVTNNIAYVDEFRRNGFRDYFAEALKLEDGHEYSGVTLIDTLSPDYRKVVYPVESNNDD